MPPRRVARSQESNPHGREGAVFARADRRGIQAHRCRKLCLPKDGATDGRQRKGAGATRSTRRCRNHWHCGEQERCGARDRNRSRYDARCRRIDSAIGGLGGCPFAQNTLVGNIPTETVIETLQERGVASSVRKSLKSVVAMNADIASKYESEN